MVRKDDHVWISKASELYRDVHTADVFLNQIKKREVRLMKQFRVLLLAAVIIGLTAILPIPPPSYCLQVWRDKIPFQDLAQLFQTRSAVAGSCSVVCG